MSSRFCIVLRVVAVVACPVLGAMTAAPDAMAQNYPTKPIRLIVPFPPGGGTDLMARVMAQKLTESLGVSVVVDNRGGAGGTIGAETGVRAAPDGYTMTVVSGSYATNAALYKLPYDPVNDIAPIALLGESAFLLSLHPSLPIRNAKELMAYDQASPGKLNYGSTGTGGITHLASELFNQMAGTRITHVPYKGTGPALNDLMGGQIQVMFGAMPAMAPQVKANRLRGIAVSTAKRNSAMPEVPTLGETVPGYEVTLWYAAWGPKALPRDIVGRWNKEVDRILHSQEMRERMAGEGVEPVGGSPERFREVLGRDVPKWQRVVKNGKISVGS
ncbi:MAG TPA: tripartite tricarboxylate transporter substrate binding protein [Burkholderiales bacterium]|nr:tripartite tricarboxylate transporter substrate binding protein [Burkholderiales bacterium]